MADVYSCCASASVNTSSQRDFLLSQSLSFFLCVYLEPASGTWKHSGPVTAHMGSRQFGLTHDHNMLLETGEVRHGKLTNKDRKENNNYDYDVMINYVFNSRRQIDNSEGGGVRYK